MVNDALPRVTVTNQALCFNVEAAKMIQTRHVVVKKVGDLLVFSPTPGADGFPVNRRKSRGNSCMIYSADLAKYRGLVPGKRYRVFEHKDGCAINIYLALGDDEL